MRPFLLSLVVAVAGCGGAPPAPAPPPTGGGDAAGGAAGTQLAGAPDPATERNKIDRLLAEIGKAQVVFIRNGTEHTAAEAVEHLRSKLDSAGAEVVTARDFIEKLATRSSMSGEPYMVRLADGTKQPSRDWLLARLNEIEAAF